MTTTHVVTMTCDVCQKTVTGKGHTGWYVVSGHPDSPYIADIRERRLPLDACSKACVGRWAAE